MKINKIKFPNPKLINKEGLVMEIIAVSLVIILYIIVKFIL